MRSMDAGVHTPFGTLNDDGETTVDSQSRNALLVKKKRLALPAKEKARRFWFSSTEGSLPMDGKQSEYVCIGTPGARGCQCRVSGGLSFWPEHAAHGLTSKENHHGSE